ncbi:membrane protein [Thalassobaculum fulvum]|uniref:Membrane protein n=1 Tax=Thalassobaculum fulvum TaxID=1633335 RepID=A0A919CRT2_9PROT|nr:peptidoglycan DD-metalloendopeptidase family protein [Thalassobaculum fulvum]GHD59613.1 membrane protein [Thalassobaculum fulvum]
MRRPAKSTPRSNPAGIAAPALLLAFAVGLLSGSPLSGGLFSGPRPASAQAADPAADPAASPAADADPERAARELRRIEEDLEGGRSSKARLDRLARELAREVDRLRTDMAETATRQQRTEETVGEVEATLSVLRHEAGEKRGVLATRQLELGQLVGALQRLARRPPEALLLMGRPPLETVRTGILLEAAIPQINAEAERLKAQLASLAEVEANIREQRVRLDTATEELARERRRLAALADEKARLLATTETRAAGTAERLRMLSESARSLRELLAGIEAQRARERAEEQRLAALVRPPEPPAPATAPGPPAPPPAAADTGAGVPLPTARPDRSRAEAAATPLLALLPAAPPITTAKGRLIRPVGGTLARSFGQSDPEGLRNRGIVIAARDDATVVAPYDGSVIYAGEFAGFGRILIIEHGEGYLTLLAGLGRIGLQVGQRVLAGEPVGTMRPRQAAGGDGRPELYVELRHNGDPIDPLPWFSGLTGKAKG